MPNWWFHHDAVDAALFSSWANERAGNHNIFKDLSSNPTETPIYPLICSSELSLHSEQNKKT